MQRRTNFQMPGESWRAPKRTLKYGETRSPKSKWIWKMCRAAQMLEKTTCLLQGTHMLTSPLSSNQDGGDQEEGHLQDRGAADEDGGAGNWPRGEQADRTGHLQAQLPGPSHLCGLVRPFSPQHWDGTHQPCGLKLWKLRAPRKPQWMQCL